MATKYQLCIVTGVILVFFFLSIQLKVWGAGITDPVLSAFISTIASVLDFESGFLLFSVILYFLFPETFRAALKEIQSRNF